MSILLISLYIIATSMGLIFIKLGSTNGAPFAIIEHSLKFNINFFTVTGVLLYGISFIVYTYLISKFDLGFIIPITTALVYTIIFIASYLIFHEAFTVIKIAAISLIILGVILLSINK